MRKTPVKYLLLLVVLFYLPFCSWGWGMLGHRIVGQIADSYLTGKARKEIKRILGTETIAMSSNWPDFIKSDTAYRYLDPWHYVDFEKGLSLADMNARLQKDTSVNAYTQTLFLVNELKKKDLPADKKRMYLRLLIHLVGDVHQPLHVSPKGTMGGNSVRVTWFTQPTNLHRLWDSQLIEYQQLSYTEYVAHINHTTAAQRRAWQGQPFTEWLFESYSLSQALHNDITESNTKLSYEYNFKQVEVLNGQLLKGGVRLAGLLNEIFNGK